MKEVADGIALSCSDDKINVTSSGVNGVNTKSLHLPYKDDKTGEYKCGENDLIYVKFRSKFCRKTCVHNMKRKCLIFFILFVLFYHLPFNCNVEEKMSAPVFIHNVCLCVFLQPVTAV